MKDFFIKNKRVIKYLFFLTFSLMGIVFYNPFVVYFSAIHWIIFLSILVVGGFIGYYIYFNKILPLEENILYTSFATLYLSIIVGIFLDGIMKEATLTNVAYYKASGSTKIALKGMVTNKGSMGIKRCVIEVTARRGNKNKDKVIDFKKMYTPSTSLGSSNHLSFLKPLKYFSKTESVVIFNKYLGRKRVRYFHVQADFDSVIYDPQLTYNLICR